MYIKRSENLILIEDNILFDNITEEQKKYILADIKAWNVMVEYTDQEILDIYTNNKIKKIKTRIELLMNSKAQEQGYDSILSACSYAGYPNDFQQEAIAFGTWRSSVWKYCYQELDKIQQGLRTEPTIEEFLLELPQLNL